MTILCYHAVDPDWASGLAVTPEAFAAQAAWLARRRHVLDLPEALARLDGRGRLPRGEVALTFDDGFASVLTHAAPVLRRLRLPATVFLVTDTLADPPRPVDWVDDPPPWPLRTLQTDEVLELRDAGVRFGSHTASHADLTQLSEDDCERDLRASRQALESLLSEPVTTLAYPRGRHDERVRAAARRAGFSHALALPERPEPTGPLAIPRVGVYRHNGLTTLRVKAARPYLPLRRSRVVTAARSLPRAVRAARAR